MCVVETALRKFEDFVNQTRGTESVKGSTGETRDSTTYITGALIASTACHSSQFRGRIENRPCRKGT